MQYERRHVLAAGTTILAGFSGCLGSIFGDDNGDEETEGSVAFSVGYSEAQVFQPERLVIEDGTTVKFIWEEGGHTLTVTEQPEDGHWDGVTEPQEQGTTHDHTFDISGDYTVQCDQHSEDETEATIMVVDEIQLDAGDS